MFCFLFSYNLIWSELMLSLVCSVGVIILVVLICIECDVSLLEKWLFTRLRLMMALVWLILCCLFHRVTLVGSGTELCQFLLRVSQVSFVVKVERFTFREVKSVIFFFFFYFVFLLNRVNSLRNEFAPQELNISCKSRSCFRTVSL